MGAISTAVTVAERDGPRVSGPNYRQSPEDIGDWQNVHNFCSQHIGDWQTYKIWQNVHKAAPQHDLRRRVQHGVNLLIAQVQKVAKFLEREQLAHMDTNFLASASKRSKERIVIQVDILLLRIKLCYNLLLHI